MSSALAELAPLHSHVPMPGETPDFNVQLRDAKPGLDVYLRKTGAILTHANRVPLADREFLMPAEEVLMHLSHATDPSEIGKHGPPVAAYVDAENAGKKELDLFAAFFYRDARVIARAALRKHPLLLRSTIMAGAALQGTQSDDYSEEEPGKILHEYRSSEDPQRIHIEQASNWKFPYYGAAETTPNFHDDVSEYRRRQLQARSGDALYGEENILDQVVTDLEGNVVVAYDSERGTARPKTIRDSVEAAEQFQERKEEHSSTGFIEFHSFHKEGKGIANQVWKDSWDSLFHKDGTLVNHNAGIAALEVQTARVNALRGLAYLFPDRKAEFEEKAAALKQRVIEHFWVGDDQGRAYFVPALDKDAHGNYQQLQILTSNAAYGLQLLEGDGERVKQMRESQIATLCTPEMWSSGGLRTLSSAEVRYYPDAYHNGSVWPLDNTVFARTVDQLGYHELATYIYQKDIDVVEKTRYYPEKITGDESIEPVLNEWTVDVITPEGEVKRIVQPGQLYQGFTWAAYQEAVDRKEMIARGEVPSEAVDPEMHAFEQAMVGRLQAIERIREMTQRNEYFVVA